MIPGAVSGASDGVVNPPTDERRLFSSIGSRVELLPETLTDLTGPLGDAVRRRFPEPGMVTQLGGRVQEIRDACGVTNEAVVPTEGDPAPRAQGADMLPVHDAVTTESRKTRQKLGGKLVNWGRHAAHTDSPDQLLERQHACRDQTTRLGGGRLGASSRLVTGVCKGHEPPHAFRRGQRALAPCCACGRDVRIGKRFIEI